MAKSKSDQIDAIVLDLFNTVKAKKKEISGYLKPTWETSCTIGTVDGNISSNVNIQTVSDVNKLVDLYAFLLQKEQFYVQAAKELGVKAVLKWQSY